MAMFSSNFMAGGAAGKGGASRAPGGNGVSWTSNVWAGGAGGSVGPWKVGPVGPKEMANAKSYIRMLAGSVVK